MAHAPYPGLRQFEREEADVFFGREQHVDAMVDRLAFHRFLAVTGTSGSGKSSLVRAGLLEALEAGLLARAGPLWRFAILRPGDHPMSALAAALLEAQGAPSEPDDVALRRAALERGPLALIEELRARPLPEGGNLLILVDQFEELFRYQGLAGREEAEAFVALLLASVAAPAMPIYVVLTMRSDFFGECSQFEGLAEAVCGSLYLCPRLTRGQIAEAVASPARVFGGRVEPELVARIVNDMGTDPDQLPLMQHAMMRLWDEAGRRGESPPALRLSDYLDANGLKGSLSRHADEILEALTHAAPERRETVRRMFCLLTGWVDNRTVRRLAPVSEVMKATGQPLAEIATIADAFRASGANLLLPPPDERLTPQTIIDISHEALIRQWQTLNDWLAEEREFMIWRGHVERDAAISGDEPLTGQRLAVARGWFERRGAVMPPALRKLIADSIAADDARAAAQRRAEEEARTRQILRRRQRAVFATIATGLVAALISAAIAGWQWRTAESERANAEFEASAAQAAQAEAERARAEAQRSLMLATDAANALIFDIVQRFRDLGLPSMISKQILDEVIKLQDELAQGGQTSPDLQLSQAEARMEVSLELLALGDTRGALAAAQKARDIFRALARSAPDNTDYQNKLAASDDRIGDVLVAQGDLAGALASFRDGLAIRKALAQKDPHNSGLQHELASSAERIGDMLRAQGDYPGALGQYRAELAIAERLASNDPGNAVSQRLISVVYEKIGDVLKGQGDLAGARAAYSRGVASAKALAQKDPGNAEWQRDLAISDERMGDILRAQNDLPGALAAYRDGVAVIKALAEKDPTNTGSQRRLSIGYQKIGDVLRIERDYPGALAAYRDSLAIIKALTAKDPSNTLWQQDLAITDEKIGGALAANSDPAGALAAYREGLAIRQALAQRDPSNTVWQGDLALSYLEMGDLLRRGLKEPSEALPYYRDALALLTELAAQNPNDPRKRALIDGLRSNADAELSAGNAQQALAEQQQAVKLCREAYAALPSPGTRAALADALGAASYMLLINRQWQPALAAADEALKLDPSQLWIETNRAHALLFLDRFDEAKAIYLADKDKSIGKETFGQAVKADFETFRKFGIDTPEMKRIEALLG